ncbi:MAG TPA: hypothetical protein VGK79_16390 [Gaiellaceae bacterium]
MIRVDELSPGDAAEHVRERVPVRRRQHQDAAVGDEQLDGLEERTRLVEMLDQLAGDHDLRTFEAERCKRCRILDVGDAGVEAEAPGLLDAVGVGVDADHRARLGADRLVEPCVARALRRDLPLIDEAEVDDGAAGDEPAELLRPVDESRARQAVDGRRPKRWLRGHRRQHRSLG